MHWRGQQMTQIKSKANASHARPGHNSQHAVSPCQRDVLEYLESMTGELSQMAKKMDAAMIAYVLDMALEEIGEVLHGERPLDGGFGKARLRRCAATVPAK